MSQSDYIKYKQVSTILKNDNGNTNNKIPSVFACQDYIDYKQYSIEKTITNTKTIYNQLTPTGKQIIFDMEKTVTNCPNFIVDSNTNNRPNRVLTTPMYFTPVPQTIKQVKNAGNLRTGCKCIVNSKYTNSNVCSCRTGNFGLVR